MNKEMTKKALIALTGLFLAGAIFAGFKINEKSEPKDQLILNLVQETLSTYHLQPKVLNDEFSGQVYAEYLNNLDGNRLFLLAEDIDKLSKFKGQLDDQLKAGSSEFFDLSYDRLMNSISRSEKIYKSLLEKPFDFSEAESTTNKSENLTWAKNEKQLRDYWRKFLKWRVANRIYNKERNISDDELLIGEDDFDSTGEEVSEPEASDSKEARLSFEELEAEARKNELELIDEWFASLREMERIEWLGVYVNSFTTVYDPHTEYFPPARQEDFETSMTGQFEGIGAQLRKDGDYIVVERIITGSASWRQGELQEGDKLLQVAQGSEEPVDIVGWRIDKAVKLIRGKKGTEVRLTVLKKDGSRPVIPIIRDVVELEATFARSALLGDDKKTGYIRLPKFYVDFYDKASNHNCAEDVKNEILRLKEEGAEGLIFDLRGNGGGSLEAAIEIVGLFIERGPVVQVKSSQRGTQVKVNRDSKIYWDGPLVVLVNNYSASASEIFAAAIQDYGRGVIMGSPRTFGKGTVQNVIDFDKVVSGGYSDLKPLGAIKITTEKFYRINGGTTQLQGLKPDVIWPDALQYLKTGEEEYEHALAVDEISSAKYAKWVRNDEQYSGVVGRANSRISGQPKAILTTEYAQWLKDLDKERDIPLKYSDFKAMQDQSEEMAKKYKNLNRSDDSLSVFALQFQLSQFNTDSGKKADYQRWFKGLAWDLHLREAVYLVKELK
jgi:carboxyl-terminal processing protease